MNLTSAGLLIGLQAVLQHGFANVVELRSTLLFVAGQLRKMRAERRKLRVIQQKSSYWRCTRFAIDGLRQKTRTTLHNASNEAPNKRFDSKLTRILPVSVRCLVQVAKLPRARQKASP